MDDVDDMHIDGERFERDPDYAFRPRAPWWLLAGILVAAPLWTYAIAAAAQDWSISALRYCHADIGPGGFAVAIDWLVTWAFASFASGVLGLAVAWRWPGIGLLVFLIIPIFVAFQVLADVPGSIRAGDVGFASADCPSGVPSWWPWWFPR